MLHGEEDTHPYADLLVLCTSERKRRKHRDFLPVNRLVFRRILEDVCFELYAGWNLR